MKLWLPFLILMCAGSVFAQTPSPTGYASSPQGTDIPRLPASTPVVTYPSESSYTITAVADGANLQTAITAAACGTVLSLAHGGSFSAATYTLPNTSCACHSDPTKWVIIRSDSFVGGSTRGTRVDPSSEYANLAHISTSGASYGVSALTNGNSCYWLGPGLDIAETTDGNTAIISIGDGSQATANYPHDFVIDHNYIHGLPTIGTSRCVSFDGNYESAVDSYFSDCHRVGQDAQAILVRDGFGPFLLMNNFLEGSGENFLSGGVDPQTGVVQSDFSIIKNHFFKPLAWRVEDPAYAGIHWSIKNIFESKLGQRGYVFGNVFENCWSDGQNGIIFSLKSSNTTSAPQSATYDWTFTNNLSRHAAAALLFSDDSASGGGPINQEPHRISFSNDLFWDIDSLKWTVQAGGTQSTILNGGAAIGAGLNVYTIWLNHETFATANQSAGINWSVSSVNPGQIFTNSIIEDSSNGGLIKNGADGDAITFSLLPSSTLVNNCIVGPSAGGSYANAAFTGVKTPANQAATYVTPGSDFHVSGGSVCHAAASDGLDMGANINAVNTATSGVTEALTNPITVTTVSPTTFSHTGGTSITITGTNFLAESGLGVIVGGAGPTSAISTDNCSVNTCTVVMSGAITLNTGDIVTIMGVVPTAGTNMLGEFTVASVTNSTHFTYTNTGIGTVSATGGTANRNSAGGLCTSISVVSPTSITCNVPAGTVGTVGVSVSQYGIPVQATTFPSYN